MSPEPSRLSARDPLAAVRTPRKHPDLVLKPSHRAGAFDMNAVDSPFLFAHGGKFWMTYVGWDGVGYQTGLASSTDLVAWTPEGLILGRGAAGSPTAYNAALTGILRDNALHGPATLRRVGGKYVGTYHAYPDPGYEAGPAVIGLCSSSDLRTWEAGEPILRPEPGNPWEAGGLYKSWLMEADGIYYLFYNAKTKTPDGAWPWFEQTGVATSRDLVHWQRHPANPVLRNGAKGAFDDCFASDPYILRHDGVWVMFYFGLCSDGHARESVAFSDDLITWRKSGEILVDIGSAGSIDSLHAHKPGVIGHAGKVYHYYCAVAPTKDWPTGEMRGIALAIG
jgi:predicted GH43/DUF377 family glycosyl hydrolase